MSGMRISEAAFSVVAIAVIIIIILAILIVPLLFLQFRSLDVREEELVPSSTSSEHLDLNITATVGRLIVEFVDVPGASARIIAEVKGYSSFFADASPLRLGVDTSTGVDGKNLSAVVSFDTYAPWPYYSLRESTYTVLVNKSLHTGLNLTITTGGVAVSTAQGVVLDGLKLNATSKGAVVSLNNGTVLAGDIKIRTATGGTMLRWNNVTVQGDRTITLNESSGIIDARFDQVVPLEGKVSVFTKQTAGETHIITRLAGDTSAIVLIHEGITGAKVVDLGGFSGTPLAFQSNNHPAPDYFMMKVNNTIGGAVVEGRWVAI